MRLCLRLPLLLVVFLSQHRELSHRIPPLVHAAAPTPPLTSADFAVNVLPGYSIVNGTDPPAFYAGTLPVVNNDASDVRPLFFWYAKSKLGGGRHMENLVFWFSGGPGCSSMKQAFSGSGPLSFNESGDIQEGPESSWTYLADIVYVDSPYGTGFSRNASTAEKAVTTEDDVASDVLKFLTAFADVFPETYKRSVYLAGQGYAGVSIPYIARDILERNRHLANEDEQINLRAIALGNSFAKPAFAYGSVLRHLKAFASVYAKLPVQTDRLLKRDHEMLMHHYYEQSEEPIYFEMWIKFKAFLLSELRNVTGSCFEWHDILGVQSEEDCQTERPDQILSRRLTEWLNRNDTRLALNAPDNMTADWQECRINDTLTRDTSGPPYKLFNSLLKEIRIVMYHGDRDMYANYIGTEEFLHSIEWGDNFGWEDGRLISWDGTSTPGPLAPTDISNGSSTATTPIKSAERAELSVPPGQPIAYGNSERNLTYLRVLDSGYDTSSAKPDVISKIYEHFVFEDHGPTLLKLSSERSNAATHATTVESTKSTSSAVAIPADSDKTSEDTGTEDGRGEGEDEEDEEDRPFSRPSIKHPTSTSSDRTSTGTETSQLRSTLVSAASVSPTISPSSGSSSFDSGSSTDATASTVIKAFASSPSALGATRNSTLAAEAQSSTKVSLAAPTYTSTTANSSVVTDATAADDMPTDNANATTAGAALTLLGFSLGVGLCIRYRRRNRSWTTSTSDLPGPGDGGTRLTRLDISRDEDAALRTSAEYYSGGGLSPRKRPGGTFGVDRGRGRYEPVATG